jgi:hypothetical protein
MNEKMDIDELKRASNKEKSARDRIERIVAAHGRCCNKGCKYPASYGYNNHEIMEGTIEISIEFYCQGTTDVETLHVPARLVNATDAELDAWFKKRSEQVVTRTGIEKKKEEMEEIDDLEKDLLAAFKHLHDPDWVHAKIVEINALINKNNGKRPGIESEIRVLEREIDPEFDVVGKDVSIFDVHDRENLKSNETKLFSMGSWRDICRGFQEVERRAMVHPSPDEKQKKRDAVQNANSNIQMDR